MKKNATDRSWIQLQEASPGAFRFLPRSLAAAGQTDALIITQWTFDETFRGTDNSPAPDFGPGSAFPIGTEDPEGNAIPPAADVIGSLRQRSDSSTPHNAWRIRCNGTFNGYSLKNRTTGAQFTVPTTGYGGITISLDWLATNNAPGHAQLQYTVDGRDYLNFGQPFAAAGGNIWEKFSFDLSSIREANNNAHFGFRVVAAYNPRPFTLITQDDSREAAPLKYGPNEAFLKASELGKDPVAEPWAAHEGNFRFDTVIVEAARTLGQS